MRETIAFLKPEISVIIPFYNGANTLERAVKSVLSQTFSNWELVLINDGSKDGSDIVVQTYLSDPRVTYFYQQNLGVSAARNLGAVNSNGRLLMFLDSDDELTQDSLDIFMKHIVVNKDADLFSAGFKRLSKKKSQITIPKKGKYFSRLSGTFLIKKDFFLMLNGYDEKMKFAENTEFFHRFNLAGGVEYLIPSVSLVYVDNQFGGSKNLQNMIDSLSYFLEKHDSTLSANVIYLYRQIIGVNHMRFKEYNKARIQLWQAYLIKPVKFGALGRLIIACLPTLARMLYPKEVKY